MCEFSRSEALKVLEKMGLIDPDSTVEMQSAPTRRSRSALERIISISERRSAQASRKR